MDACLHYAGGCNEGDFAVDQARELDRKRGSDATALDHGSRFQFQTSN
jgi:hypothetical protein